MWCVCLLGIGLLKDNKIAEEGERLDGGEEVV